MTTSKDVDNIWMETNKTLGCASSFCVSRVLLKQLEDSIIDTVYCLKMEGIGIGSLLSIKL